jgi:hypothetical protein
MEKSSTSIAEPDLFDGSAWFDPLEAGVRDQMRGFIEALLEEELAASGAAACTNPRRRPARTSAREHGSRWGGR